MMNKDYYKDKFENENENYVQKTNSPEPYKKWYRCNNCITLSRSPSNVTVLCTDCLTYLGYITFYDFNFWIRCDNCIETFSLPKTGSLNRCVDCGDNLNQN